MSKDQITCHVLDTTAGRPAANIRVRLQHTLASSSANQAPTYQFESLTDADGRIKTWQQYPSSDTASSYTLDQVMAQIDGASIWTLRFDTGSYYGDANTFFPEAVIVFRVEKGQHYHVPLLLSPYSYTTYRGS